MTSLSVVLCTYNGAPYLAEQLESIAAQTRLPDEMVIRDDGSKDETVQYLEAFAARMPFAVSIIHNSVRKGAPGNFWLAIHDATSDVIALCDQDDVWLPSKLERAMDVLDGDSNVGATFSDGLCIDKEGAFTGRSLWKGAGFTVPQQEMFESDKDLEVLLRHPVVTGATLAFRTSLLPALNPGPEMPHDYWLSVAVAVQSRIVPIREPLIKYRLHDSNAMGLLPEYLFPHRLRYAFDSGYRRQLLSVRLSQLDDLFRLLEHTSGPRVTGAEKQDLQRRIERLKAGLSVPNNIWHRISFVRRG
jgi:glycosyltransferase involved in cell wall biosynthesis